MHAVQRGVVLISAESKHREPVCATILTRHQLYAGQRGRHGGEVAELVGRQRQIVADTLLRSADIRLCLIIARDLVACGGHFQGIEDGSDLGESCIGNEDVFVGRTLHFKSF